MYSWLCSEELVRWKMDNRTDSYITVIWERFKRISPIFKEVCRVLPRRARKRAHLPLNNLYEIILDLFRTELMCHEKQGRMILRLIVIIDRLWRYYGNQKRYLEKIFFLLVVYCMNEDNWKFYVYKNCNDHS